MERIHRFGLEEVFELQDSVAKRHLSDSELLRDTFKFVSDCLALTYEILSSTRFEPEKQTAIRLLSSDALSHTIVGARTGLWGNFPESFGLLRGAMEGVAQLRFVVKEKKYAVYNYERSRKFERVSYETAVKSLGDFGRRIDGLHGKISEACNHSTAARAKFRSFKLDGEEYDRLGFAYDVEAAESGFYYAMDTCTMILDSLVEAFEQEDSTFAWTSRVTSLFNRIESLRSRFLEKFSAQEAGK
jgi:hypothetical protein